MWGGGCLWGVDWLEWMLQKVTGQGIRGYREGGLKAGTPLANGRENKYVSDAQQFLIPRSEMTCDQRRVRRRDHILC